MLRWSPGPPAVAQTYPNRPIRLVIPYPPGGAVDLIARLYGQALTVRLGQPIVIENKPGSGGNLASDTVAKATPDGYTLLHGADNVFMSNPHIYGRMPFDPFKDLVPVSSLSSNQLVLAVHPAVPANTLREFVELARATRPPLFYASIGNGSQHHLAMEMLKQHVGIDLIHVPYRGGGPAAMGLLSRRGLRNVRRRIAGADGPGRQGEGARLDRDRAKSGDAGAPDHQRDLSRLRGVDLAGPVRPGRHAAADRRPAAQRAEGSGWRSPSSRSGWPTPAPGEPYLVTAPDEFAARMKGDYEKYGKLIRSIGVKVE